MQLLGFYIAFVSLVFIGLMALDINGYVRGSPDEPPRKRHAPKTLLIVPCRGIDLTLRENLTSMMRQNYGRYKAVAVVDSENDPALRIVGYVGMSYLFSDSRCRKCSGKVRAIVTALEKFRNYGVYVIADSDIFVDKEWLERIVAPLADKKIGLSTMFPYFKPVKGAWSKVKLVWGFVGEALMEHSSTRFGWGGAIAFRKDLLDRESMHFFKNSEYSVSDDICLTKMAQKKGLRIAYTKASRPVVNSAETFGSFAEWSSRQAAFAILGNRRILYYGLAFYIGEIVVLISGIALAIAVSPIFAILLAHALGSAYRNFRRAEAFYPSIALMTLAMPFFYLANLIVASGKKSVTWRGTTYKL